MRSVPLSEEAGTAQHRLTVPAPGSHTSSPQDGERCVSVTDAIGPQDISPAAQTQR